MKYIRWLRLPEVPGTMKHDFAFGFGGLARLFSYFFTRTFACFITVAIGIESASPSRTTELDFPFLPHTEPGAVS